MRLLPAAWLGLGSWPFDPLLDVGAVRNLSALFALAAGWCEWRGRRRAALGCALAVAVVSAGYWSLAWRRPYGLLVDPGITRWAADTMVTARAGGTDGPLAGEPGAPSPWRLLAAHLPPDFVLALPSLLPAVVLGVSALAIGLVWPDRSALLAAVLWVGASTGALDAQRGVGFLDWLWRRPGHALEWTAAAVVALALARLFRNRPRAALAAVLLLVLAASLGGGPSRLGPGPAVLLLTLDQHVWVALGVAGLVLGRDPAATALIAAGGVLVLVSTAIGAVDTWTAAAFYRLGLVLAGARAIDEVAARTRPWATAAAVSLVLAGGYLAWWDPSRTDAVARESLGPVPEALVQTTDWIAAHTDPQAAFIAHPDYAPAVAALAGRRVLRAPGFVAARDEERRRRLERAVLEGDWPEALRRRYDVRYVLLGPGQFSELGLDSPDALAARGHFRELFRNDKGMRVYELGEGRH